MSEPCDDCGADGVTDLCICKPREVKRAAVPIARDVLMVKTRSAAARPLSESKVIPKTHSTPSRDQACKVICCRCRHVHMDVDRINEWGRPAGKVMAGRRTECPTGCGYHVTVPYDPEVHK